MYIITAINSRFVRKIFYHHFTFILKEENIKKKVQDKIRNESEVTVNFVLIIVETNPLKN